MKTDWVRKLLRLPMGSDLWAHLRGIGREMRLGGRNLRPSVIVWACIGLGAAWFIWPTPYAVYREKPSQVGPTGRVVRVNRFTGREEIATERGWQTREQESAELDAWSEQESAELAAEAEEERTLRATMEALKAVRVDDDRGQFGKLAILNPTEWELTGETVVEYFRKGEEGFEPQDGVSSAMRHH